MRGRTRVTIGIAAGGVLLLAIVLIGVIVLTQTDYGRGQARRLVLRQLGGSVNGTVRIGRLSGNLLQGVTLSELSIADTTGAQFLEADTLELRYSLRQLLSRRIHLSDVRLVHPTIILDKPPGGQWNFTRLFPSDTTLADTTAPGLGSWLRIEDLTVSDGRLVVRNEWTPADTLEGAVRDRAIAVALSDSGRLRVLPVAGGYQTIQEFLDVDSHVSFLRLANPDSTDVVVEVASLSTIAFPFRPPAARVRDLSGRFVVSDDSLRFQDVRVVLPESRFFAEGAYATETGDLRATLRTRPIVLGDLRWIAPTLPDNGGGVLELAVATNGPQTRVAARDLDLRLEGARLTGHAEATVGDTVLLGPTELRFTGLDTRLAERFAPGARIPVDGVLNGHLSLTGDDDLSVDAELVFIERDGGQSRVTVDGRIGIGEGIRARDLQIRFDPFQVDLARAFAPNLPVGGTITGSATVTGSLDTQVRIATDLVHRAVTGTSRLVGDARLTFGEPLRFDVDLGLRPVALRTVGRFAPGAGLYGSAPGSLSAQGTMEDLSVALDVAVNGGGSFQARGSLDLAGARQSYDLETRFVHFDADQVFVWAPQTMLTGTLTARGVGTDPAAMRAVVAGDLADLRPDSTRVEAARVRVRIADGLAAIEQGTLRLASASVEMAGNFGLAGGREGELSYTIQVDSLSDFAGYLPEEDTIIPADTTSRDSHAAASDTAALAPAPLAGSVRLAGVVVGSLEGFDLRGTADLDDVVVAGNRIAEGRVEYAWLDALTGDSFEVDAALDSLRTAGLAFDSLSARVRHDGADGNGIADLAVYQDEGHEYRVRSRYDLAPERSEVRLDSLRLRLDETRWTLSESGTVRWGGRGIEVDRIELRDGKGGRIFVDGRFPTEGAGDFELAIEQLQIRDFAALLPDTVEASGQLSVHATAEGTRASPRLRGDLRLADFAYGGRIPALDATFDYADTDLALRAELRNDGRALLVAEGTLPVDLSLGGTVEERLLDRPMHFDVRLDRLQLDSLPLFTEAVTGLRGRVEGTVALRGTPRLPEAEGVIHLDEGAMHLSQLGIDLREVSAALTIREDALVVDSLVGHSDGGHIRAAGTLDITTPAEPGFDLTFQARGAEVVDNKQARLVVDSDLTIEGPFDGVRVTGDIDVLEGVIYIPEPENAVIDLDDPMVIAVIDTTRVDPEVLPRPNPLLDNLEVDVDIQIARDTWARSPDANIELYTPASGPLSLQLDQSKRTLTLQGSIQMDRGEYTYSGRRFEVSSGSIIFLGTPELNPLLQILARYEVPQPRGEALAILITIGGTLAEPRIELGSNAQPPLSQTDLISYLAFGRSSSSLLVQGGSGVSDDGAGSGDLGALATQKMAGVALGALMDDAIKDLEAGGLNELGLDVFRISPAELPEELGLDEGGNLFRSTELEAGRYLTPRFFVAGKGRPTSTWPGIRFEYRTPDGFVWMTTWEPRYLPSEPTFDLDTEADQTRVFGAFLLWEWRY